MKRLHLALLLLPAPELLADTRDQALNLPDVVISANRQVQARNDSSAANTVFTRFDIDWLEIWLATGDTLMMLGGSLLFTIVLGLPLGVH